MIRYRARWVLPIASPPIPNGIVAVDGGIIAYVGSVDGAPPGDDVNLGKSVLIPGLVNAHCHLELTAMRGFLEDLDFRSWILRLVNARRAVLDRDALLDSARYGLEEGVRAGITSYADTSESGVGLYAMREAGVRGIMYQEVFGPNSADASDQIEALRRTVEGQRYLETPLVRVGVSPHAPYTVSDDLFRATVDLAREQKLPVAIHIAESAMEHELVVEAKGGFADGLRARGFDVAPRGRTPVSLLESLGVLDLSPLLIHCVRVDERDIAAISKSRSAVAHCPASNAKLGHGVAPLVDLMNGGVTVGLGSDSMASNNRMDIIEEARVALLMARARSGSLDTPSARDVLALATIGGAKAIGIGDIVGTLEPGKQADLAAFSLDETSPTQNPIAAAIFAVTGSRARFVCVAGKVLLRDGILVSPREGLSARMETVAYALNQWQASQPAGSP